MIKQDGNQRGGHPASGLLAEGSEVTVIVGQLNRKSMGTLKTLSGHFIRYAVRLRRALLINLIKAHKPVKRPLQLPSRSG